MQLTSAPVSIRAWTVAPPRLVLLRVFGKFNWTVSIILNLLPCGPLEPVVDAAVPSLVVSRFNPNSLSVTWSSSEMSLVVPPTLIIANSLVVPVNAG